MSVFSSGGMYILIKNIANNFLNCLFALCYAPEKEITFLNISYRYVYVSNYFFVKLQVFDILVKAYGADPNLRDNAGKKPRQYMQLTAVSSGGAQGGFHMSNDTFRQLKDRRRNRNRQLADKNSGILRFGSLSVKVKKTTEAFNNYFGHNDKKSSTGDQPYSLPMIGVGPDEDTAKMPPPKKLGSIKKRKSKRAADFHQAVAISKSAPATPIQGPSPIKEEKHSDSDSEYGFDSQWTPR